MPLRHLVPLNYTLPFRLDRLLAGHTLQKVVTSLELTGELSRHCVGVAVNTVVYCLFEERSPTDAESVSFETCSGTGSATGVATEEAPEVEVEGLGQSQIAQTSESNLQLAAFSQTNLLQPVPTLLQKEQSVFRGLCQALLCGHACSDVRDLSVSKKS